MPQEDLEDKHQQLLKKNVFEEENSPALLGREGKWGFLLLILFFFLAFLPRIYFLYFVSNPDNPGAGWFGDAYHHWQIAYLTKEIGLHQGFLRLWDLKGMEYFWGLLHPMLTILAFVLTGSIDIGVERAMTAFMGSVSVVLVYLVVKKYWNNSAGVASMLFAALNPVGIFNDASGMVEPVGITFLLLAIYFWPKKPIATGLSLTLALMARAEYWVFAIGLAFAMLTGFKKVKIDIRAVTFISFLIFTLLYAKYLLDQTGNPIYPFYWNYVTNIFGTWQYKTEFTNEEIMAKYLFRGIFAVSVVPAIFVLWKKPKGMLVYLLGLGNWIFLGASIGLGAYIGSYASYIWYVRFMILPYIFIGILASLILFVVIPKVPIVNLIAKLKLNWVILIVLLIIIQPVWFLIMKKYSTTEINWTNTKILANSISENYNGGGLLFVEGNPEITYALVKENHLDGKNIVSQMYDPYFYFTDDPYQDWGNKREIVLNWLKDKNIRTIVTYIQYKRYEELAAREEQYFSKPVNINGSNIVIYQVNDKLYQDEI